MGLNIFTEEGKLYRNALYVLKYSSSFYKCYNVCIASGAVREFRIMSQGACNSWADSPVIWLCN